jgi:hypothetical protein
LAEEPPSNGFGREYVGSSRGELDCGPGWRRTQAGEPGERKMIRLIERTLDAHRIRERDGNEEGATLAADRDYASGAPPRNHSPSH